jgi:DUF1365 family protein
MVVNPPTTTLDKQSAGPPAGAINDGRAPTTAASDAPTAPRAEPLRSALYECAVMHHRLSPHVHQFTHHIFLLALDLDELDAVARRVRGFSHNRRNVYAFHDRDHLTLPGFVTATVKDNILAWIASQGRPLPDVPAALRVTLLTLPRVFGYVFNPVSFYFVHHAATGQPVCAVAQVGNTFGEMKPYLLADPLPDGSFRLVAPKHFYVSPFSPLDLCFDFKLRVPDAHLEIHVDEFDGPRPVLLSALTGRRHPLTTARLWGATLRCPLVTLKVIFLIHWHAFVLWLKRLPWHPKADQPDLQRDVFNPSPHLSGKNP